MYYAQIRKFDIANGPGIRSSLFVSGCTHQCLGCFNEAYRNFRYGTRWTKKIEAQFMDQLQDPNVQGVTILGGEPLDQIYDCDLVHLVKRIKEEAQLNLWLYSGYTYEEIMAHPKRLEILSHCDVLVDGKFILDLRDLKLKFRGSRNQRIIKVQASLASGQIHLSSYM